MSSTRNLLVAAGLLCVIGLGLVLFHPQGFTGYSMGDADGGKAYSSEVSIAFDGARLVTTQELIGYGLMWLGTLLAAGVAGHRLSTRRSVTS
ncbi:MAG: hypothetical protein QOJ72_2168 [Nocardioidaceae bacterium]|jgi:hypothetical protein|nr:hypothetical protein [Nocardioidaceae bacterium]